MLLLQASGFLNFEYELHFRKNTYDENGNVVEYDIDQTDGDFFEVTLRNGNSKVLSILFDLDGFFVSLELREEGRKNSIMLMKRNYNGVFYIFPRNCLNLKKETIDYYLDYYNNNTIIDNQYAKQLISEIHNIISGIVTSVGNSKHSKMLKTISESNFDDLFDNDYFRRQGYLSPISVLPPNIRPDNNHHYTMIQVASGCKIMAQRKKACGFCTSFHLKYYERNISELKYHISCLINCNPITTKGQTVHFCQMAILSLRRRSLYGRRCAAMDRDG